MSSLQPAETCGRCRTIDRVKILVVDDDRAVRDALRRVLTLAGYEVQVADGGAEAIEAVVQAVPDAVVLDIGMPDVDGLGGLQRACACSATACRS